MCSPIFHLLGDADRYARVTVIRGSHKDCMDYKVRKLQGGVREESTPVHTCVHACVVCHRDKILDAGLGAACGEAKSTPQQALGPFMQYNVAHDCSDVCAPQVGPLATLTRETNVSQAVVAMTRPGQVAWVKRPRSDIGGTWLGQVLSPVRLII